DDWKLHRAALQEFLADFSPESCLAIGLYTVLQKPFRDHLQRYACVLSKLKAATGQSLEKEKISDASEKFAKLRSYVSQIVDEAGLTAALWKSVGTKFTAVWQWKIQRAVGQALVDKRDVPVWGDRGKGFAPPVCRCATFAFRSEGRFKSATYEGEWCLGKPHGKGKLVWPNGQNFAGDFKEGLKNGFGISLIPQGSNDHYDCYKCHWREGQMDGYGICEGERYIGMWENDQRHGPGIVVLQSGVCFQRTFHLDRMVGSGVLLLEDDLVYEGNFTNDFKFGKLTFPNGFVLEETFTNKSREGLQVPGVMIPSGDQQAFTKSTIQLGQEDFPVEKRWEDLYDQFLAFVHAGGQADTEESFMGFHALESSLHPLGKLLKTLILVFQSTYSGIGANKHLLRMAQEEVKDYAKKIWEFYQSLLQLAFKVKGFNSPQNTEKRYVEGSSVILPLILPYFYPDLLMLYMVAHEKQDEVYGQGIISLSCFSDTTLLEYLDVQKDFWPLKDLTLTSNQRQSLVKDHCFLSATECLQKLIATMDPQEKLEILQKTYEEIEETINQLLGKDIQHLGAEIHLIRDLMDPTNGGKHDFLLTALESCYQLIQEIRLP
ncbi:ALS2 C-terminal-like protein, partial [Ophiophagus hannah]